MTEPSSVRKPSSVRSVLNDPVAEFPVISLFQRTIGELLPENNLRTESQNDTMEMTSMALHQSYCLTGFL
ncbi:hypothetical protein Q5P01_008814 [Channa striata]|uniref:Uncharacterized protein n=1 Tax=Channa striata TaxID=64152 RepID=A0AA88N1D9_CHASR|nr:hypothetical protein Q5P01_008814 [Channa striata]